MVIGIEAERANNPVKTGVEHYAKQLILQFAEIDKENEFVLYLRTEPEEWIKRLPPNFQHKVMPFPLFWTQLRVSWELFLHPVDALFVPASALPVFSPKNSVCTIHDAAFLFYPNAFTLFMRNFLHWSYKFIGWRARKIIAVSHATKEDLIQYYKIKPEKVEVVYHGYTPVSGPSPHDGRLGGVIGTPHNIASVTMTSPGPSSRGGEPDLQLYNSTTLQLPPRFILFLSTLQPRKNLEGLIQAFKIFKSKHPDDEHKLVVAGGVGWKAEKILATIEANKDIVIYLNHVTDSERALLYQKASALCVPSFYEGFGMWILEAFYAGIPVITSNVSSMPEVGGNACEYCDPTDANDIARAIGEVLLNKEKSLGLVAKGKERLKDFSWRKCGEETLRLIRF